MAALLESVIYEDQQISDNFPIKNGTRVNSNTTPALEQENDSQNQVITLKSPINV